MGKARARKCEILVLNNIAQVGLKRLPTENYALVKESKDPQAILVRSADLHKHEFGPSLRAVGRAGAGVNNIPVPALSKRGVPVFNAPGANANAVKELVLAGMLIAARNLAPALEFVRALKHEELPDEDLERRVEEGKKQFAGSELPGHTLGVIGLGKIGSLVADAAIRLGMNVQGYDPDITVEAAWSLPAQVKRAASIEEILRASHFVSLHVPLNDRTRNLVNAKNIDQFKSGAVLLNFSRDGIVAEQAVLKALASGRLRCYVTDFPGGELLGHPAVIALPHLGASTREAEDNCAIMVVDQVRDYLEHGNLQNAVNFPEARMAREAPYRLAIANANVPDMLGSISHALGRRKINIHNMLNKSKGEMAYTLVDADSPVPADALDELAGLNGVLAVRYLPLDG
jgi:D-3-phosphoglycerate dehydrogenase / 2-oxoglutarate reductase